VANAVCDTLVDHATSDQSDPVTQSYEASKNQVMINLIGENVEGARAMESDGAAAVGGGVALYTYNTNRSVETALNTSMVRYKLISLLHTHAVTHTHSCVAATAAW